MHGITAVVRRHFQTGDVITKARALGAAVEEAGADPWPVCCWVQFSGDNREGRLIPFRLDAHPPAVVELVAWWTAHTLHGCASAWIGAKLLTFELMNNHDDHRWDLSESDKGNLPESDAVFEEKFAVCPARNWPDWLAKNLTFPFTVTRKEDDDDAYFAPGAAKARFRLGHKMAVLELAEENVDRGIMICVREKGQVSCVPLDDVKVTPKTDANFWPVREYVVWFANRC